MADSPPIRTPDPERNPAPQVAESKVRPQAPEPEPEFWEEPIPKEMPVLRRRVQPPSPDVMEWK